MGEFKKEGFDLRTVNGPEILRGINDLKCIYAFSGASQGDETNSNDVESYKFMDGWWCVNHEFKCIDYLNQEEVNKRSEQLKLENEEYIKQLKESGEYGKSDGHITISYIPNPKFDDTNINKSRIELASSYTYDIWDFSK